MHGEERDAPDGPAPLKYLCAVLSCSPSIINYTTGYYYNWEQNGKYSCMEVPTDHLLAPF